MNQENPLISICIPCYNAGKHIVSLLQKLEPLSDLAEICIFDNGSSDGLDKVLSSVKYDGRLRYIRGTPFGPIDHSWLNAVAMADGKYVKLQLADDTPNADSIRNALNYLEANSSVDFVLSAAQAQVNEGNNGIKNGIGAYYSYVNKVRGELLSFKSIKERAEYFFSKCAEHNNLGDINGLIYRRGALDGISANTQSYYNFVTHPDAEILFYLVANREGHYFNEVLSTQTFSTDSPALLASRDWGFSMKVYELPKFTHTLMLLCDPGYEILRRHTSKFTLFKVMVKLGLRIIKLRRCLKPSSATLSSKQ